MTQPIAWTHPSVRALLDDEAGSRDPFEVIEHRARSLTLEGLERGWAGPPFDPFQLAELVDVETVPREDLDDARLVSVAGEGCRIEFNPHRRPARVRFSVAHELGHLLFPDHGDRVRYRNASHSRERRPDDWQLEVLCNVAAAELLMPAGAFPQEETENLSLTHLMDLRATFGVSTEALLRRVVKLTDLPVALFASARLDDGGYRIDYVVDSRAWHPNVRQGEQLGHETLLAHCTAVGFSTDGSERWPGEQDVLRVQAVGVPPFPGDRYPRVVGLVQPSTPASLGCPGSGWSAATRPSPRSKGRPSSRTS